MSEYLINNYRKVFEPMRIAVSAGEIIRIGVSDSLSIAVENANAESNESIGYVEFSENKSFVLPVKVSGASRTIFSSSDIPFIHEYVWIHFADTSGESAAGTMIVMLTRLKKITDVPAPTVSLEIENSDQYGELQIEVNDPNDRYKGTPIEIAQNDRPATKHYLDE